MARYIINTTADKCQFNYSCLKCNGKNPCKATDCVNNKILFVDAKEDLCNYKLSYGNDSICMCPVRAKIYLDYHV